MLRVSAAIPILSLLLGCGALAGQDSTNSGKATSTHQNYEAVIHTLAGICKVQQAENTRIYAKAVEALRDQVRYVNSVLLPADLAKLRALHSEYALLNDEMNKASARYESIREKLSKEKESFLNSERPQTPKAIMAWLKDWEIREKAALAREGESIGPISTARIAKVKELREASMRVFDDHGKSDSHATRWDAARDEVKRRGYEIFFVNSLPPQLPSIVVNTSIGPDTVRMIANVGATEVSTNISNPGPINPEWMSWDQLTPTCQSVLPHPQLDLFSTSADLDRNFPLETPKLTFTSDNKSSKSLPDQDSRDENEGTSSPAAQQSVISGK